MTTITSPSDLIFDEVRKPIQKAIIESSSLAVKAATIQALSVCTFYGGAADTDIEEIMGFLMEIMTSDGHSIAAADEIDPVLAAAQAWGFLCTSIDDMSDSSEDAIEALAEQLSSGFVALQISAAENIALLYEKSLIFADEGDLADHPQAELLHDDAKVYRKYMAFRRTDHILDALQAQTSNASGSVHRLNKEDRKALKTNLRDVANSIENPQCGPRYSAAIDEESGKHYGSRMTVRIAQQGSIRIDRWWKLCRLQALRRILQGGFVQHFKANDVVSESLPLD